MRDFVASHVWLPEGGSFSCSIPPLFIHESIVHVNCTMWRVKLHIVANVGNPAKHKKNCSSSSSTQRLVDKSWHKTIHHQFVKVFFIVQSKWIVGETIYVWWLKHDKTHPTMAASSDCGLGSDVIQAALGSKSGDLPAPNSDGWSVEELNQSK